MLVCFFILHNVEKNPQVSLVVFFGKNAKNYAMLMSR